MNCMEKELIQYIIVNKDLDMSKGKIAAQVGHVCTNVASDLTMNNIDIFLEWLNNNQKKIILQAHQIVLEKLVDKGFWYIHDIGCNEVPVDSLTAVSLGIMTREEAKPYVKRLQVL